MARKVRQLGNTMNGSAPAVVQPAVPGEVDDLAPNVTVEAPAPVRRLNTATLLQLGGKYKGLFDKYASERMPAEQKWLKNLRQYLGVYDPEIEKQLPPNRSRAYPRLTRMKCISMRSRLMNLMFPGNEDNWELKASPSPEMSPERVAEAVSAYIQELSQGGTPPPMTQETVDQAVKALADKQAEDLTNVLKDQFQELGGEQSRDWIALNSQIVDSGVKYGIGVLEGPYVRKVQQSGWGLVAGGGFQPVVRTIYKPQFSLLPVWDFYPDMSARELPGEGYFKRKVLGRSALRRLGARPDFFEEQIKAVITQMPGGNYKPRSFETELKSIGTAINAESISQNSTGREKYEIIIWCGPVSSQTLREAGADVPDSMMADDIEAELWMVDNYIIKAEINPWRKLGVDVRTVHVFQFDEDDTSPVGQGLPAIVRDSQLSVCASTRMALDNASVTCGPNLELNTALLRADQDLTSVEGYKMWYRDDESQTAQFPAVREIKIDGHLNELQSLTKMFLEFAELETFVGPMTGGDMSRQPSEPMRTAAGASMLRGDAALPFKDTVRNYDSFTQSVIWSMVQFNRKLNPDLAPEADYDVIPRGATSLIAKEVRGMQIDVLSQTLTPEERDHVDERKFVKAKFASRDLEGMLVTPEEAARRKQARADELSAAADRQNRMLEAQIKTEQTAAYKNVAQGQVNSAKADGQNVKSAKEMIEIGEGPDAAGQGQGNRAGGQNQGSGKSA